MLGCSKQNKAILPGNFRVQFLASHIITAVDGFDIWQRHLVNRAWFWSNLYSPATIKATSHMTWLPQTPYVAIMRNILKNGTLKQNKKLKYL
jgi:hypothetical protein